MGLVDNRPSAIYILMETGPTGSVLARTGLKMGWMITGVPGSRSANLNNDPWCSAGGLHMCGATDLDDVNQDYPGNPDNLEHRLGD